MRVLVACEFSGVVRRAFRELGHDAWSCDLLRSEDDSPFHIQGSVIDHDIIKQPWDALLAFPDCTYLTVSANRWANAAWRMEARHWALAFVKTLWAMPIRLKCLENPISVLPTMWKRPSQIIHPHQFWSGPYGEGESKATCLYLENLDPLVPTTPDEPGRVERVWKEPPSPDRWKNRARLHEGIAKAMAHQFGNQHG